jgi:hypothetical protein
VLAVGKRLWTNIPQGVATGEMKPEAPLAQLVEYEPLGVILPPLQELLFHREAGDTLALSHIVSSSLRDIGSSVSTNTFNLSPGMAVDPASAHVSLEHP